MSHRLARPKLDRQLLQDSQGDREHDLFRPQQLNETVLLRLGNPLRLPSVRKKQVIEIK